MYFLTLEKKKNSLKGSTKIYKVQSPFLNHTGEPQKVKSLNQPCQYSPLNPANVFFHKYISDYLLYFLILSFIYFIGMVGFCFFIIRCFFSITMTRFCFSCPFLCICNTEYSIPYRTTCLKYHNKKFKKKERERGCKGEKMHKLR